MKREGNRKEVEGIETERSGKKEGFYMMKERPQECSVI